MATTKKSTQAKTKKPASRSAKTVRAAKTTKSSVSAKAVRTGGTSKVTPVITKLNVLTAVLSVGLAVAAALLMNNQAYQLVQGLVTKNELAAGSAPSLVPAVHHLYDIELRWAVVVIMALSAVMPLLVLTAYKARYAAALRAKVNALRWIDMAVIGALTLEVTALLSGVQDIFTLKLIAGLVVITCALAWVAEKRNLQAGRLVKSELTLSIVAGVLPWLLIAGYALGTVIYGQVTSPWYVYALYAVGLFSFIGQGLTLVNNARRKLSFVVAERNYLTISLIAKVAFAVILIAGLQK